MNVIDARGLSCPQPVILLKQCLDTKPEVCELLVDNRTSLENTTRFGESAGYTVTSSEDGEEFRIQFKRK